MPPDGSTVWIALDPRTTIARTNDPQRTEIRSKAARASAKARKATIARRTAARASSSQLPVAGSSTTSNVTTMRMLRDEKLASDTLETLLWSQIMHSTDLFATALFTTSTGTNTRGVYGLEGPAQPCTVFLRGMAMRCMQVQMSMLARSPGRAPSTLMICLGSLAGWEKVHGDPAAGELHSKALKAITSVHEDEAIEELYNTVNMLRTINRTVHRRFLELSSHIASDESLTIAPNLDTMRTQAKQTPGHPTYVLDYKIYNLHRAETRTLLLLLDRLANYNLIAANAWPTMHELSLLTLAWRPRRAPPSAWATRTALDNLEDLALYHIRAAMISVQGAWSLLVGKSGPSEDQFFRASDSMDEHYLENQKLETEVLFNTKFEEAALWSVFILTASATPKLWCRRSFDILHFLMNSPRIQADSFEKLESILRKYAYRPVVHRTVCRALYQTVTHGSPIDNTVALRDLTVSLADLII